MKEDALYREIKNIRKDIERIREKNEKYAILLENFFEFPYITIDWDDRKTEIVLVTDKMRSQNGKVNGISYFTNTQTLVVWSEASNEEYSVNATGFEQIDEELNEVIDWIKKVNFHPEILLKGIEDD